MSSTKARELPKGSTPRLPGGGGSSGSNKSGNRNTSKSDIKSDKADLNPRMQATAEQMQIARIIEQHRAEDPELTKKIRQIIEITGSSADAASMALHIRDNNLEEAITLLTEGGPECMELEWEKAGKKKKPKNVGQKGDAVKDAQSVQRKENGPGGRERSEKRNDREPRPERGDRDRDRNNPEQGDGTFDSRRGGRGRGRGEGRGGRGGGMGRGGLRIENNKENDQSSDRDGFGTKFSNGPSRGGRGRGSGRGGYRGGDRDRDPSRTFASRARGPREGDFSHHTIDVWENSQADTKTETKTTLKVDQWDEFPSAEDWDNEEYTGSLSESKVFVASTQAQSVTVNTAPLITAPSNGENHLATDTASNGIVGPTNHLGSNGNVNVVAGQSIDLSLLLSKPAPATSGPNPGANLLASIQSSYSSAAAAAQQIPGANAQQLPPRPKVTASQTSSGRQRGPPSTKIPSSGVEMPDESVAKLDVQFGGLDFGATGSAFNSVVQHGPQKGGGNGDMMYGNVAQQSNIVDNYVAAGEKEMVQSKAVPPPESGSPFQSQRSGTQSQQSSSGPLISDSITKSVPLSPQQMETGVQHGGHSSVQSQNQQQKAPITQSSQSQQQPSYTNSSSGNPGSAFVTYNTKPAPGFSAPVFPPGVSQTQHTAGAYNTLPTGQVYGSQPSMIMTQHQQSPSAYGMGLSTYGSLPIVSASVQPSHIPSQAIPNQNLTQMTNSTYGVPGGIPGNPYQSASTIPNSIGYTSGSAYSNPYQKLSQMNTQGQLQGTKETANDVGNSNSTAPSSVAQMGPPSLQGNSSASSGAGSKMSSNASNPTTGTGSSSSKLQNTTGTGGGGGGGGGGAGGMPPGMMITPQYILNQGALQGMPMYGFQGPTMYGSMFDENQVQFLPRIPHPALAAAGYYDANASSFTPGGVGRTDGSSMQSYPGSDARFSRSDSSAASPVPSNLPGQTTQPMYNIPQGAGYYYLGNNAALMHPGAFAQYAPPQMYPTTAMVTPNNPSSGAPHTVSNHQYQNKGVYGTSYPNPYETNAQSGLTNVTDYVNKNSYTTGSGVGGPNNSATGGKGSTSSTGSSQQQQSTDMSSSFYGNKGGQLNKMNPYDKQQYGGSTSSPYNSMGQQTNPLGGTGMGTPYNVYMPQQAPVLPPLMFQDGSSVQQRQGQPKGGKQQYGQPPYWSGN